MIPPRKNAKSWKPTNAGAIARNEALSAQRYWVVPWGDAGVEITEEAALKPPSRGHASHNPAGQRMHCLNRMGQSLMARGFDRQVAEIQIRITVLNRYSALGIPVTEPLG